LHSKTRKIRIQLEDNDGDKYNLSLEGALSKEKMFKILTLINSLDNNNSSSNTNTNTDTSLHSRLNNNTNSDSLGTKLWNIIENEINDVNFTSNDVLKTYNQIYRETTQLSIVSTYLTRFFTKNKLIRRKDGKEWIYSASNSQITQSISSAYNKYTSAHSNSGLMHHYEKPSTVYDLHQ
jgi:predicted transcriptional regulator